LIALSLNGARNQFGSNLGIAQFDIDPKRITRAAYYLEQSGKNNDVMLAGQLKSDTKVQNAFAGLEYDENALRDQFEKFQMGRSKQKFGDYLGSPEVVNRTGTNKNPNETLEKGLKIKADDFNNLSTLEQNVMVWGSKEPTLVTAFKEGMLPPKVQQAVKQALATKHRTNPVTPTLQMKTVQEPVTEAMNKAIGENLESVQELQDVLLLVTQNGTKGSIGDTFAGIHALSKGTAAIEQPTFTKDMIPGLENQDSIRPDYIRPEARRTLDVKTGYIKGSVSDRQLRDVDRMIAESQKQGSKVQQWLEKQYGIKEGLRGQDILVMSNADGNSQRAAQAVFETALEVTREARLRPINVYYMDDTGIIWQVIGRGKTVRIGTRIPD
jgi:hypothetical protein